MELSEKIQKLRKEHNMTQEQFAEKLFVSRTAVSKMGDRTRDAKHGVSTNDRKALSNHP